MAQFILGNSFKDKINRSPRLRDTIWRLESLVLGMLLRVLARVPVDYASAFGRWLGRAVGPRLPKQRSILKNLRLAFPDKSTSEIETLSHDIWANAGAVLTEFAGIRKIVEGDRVKVALAGYIDAFNRSDRPIILVSAHLSNWEVIGCAVTRLINPVSAPYTPPSNPWLAKKLIDYRKPLGVELFERDASIRPMMQKVAQGQSLALLMDQRVDSGKPVPFFGMDKLTTLVPARLGLRFNCEIVPVRVERQYGANYVVTFYPPVEPDDRDADDMTQAINVTTKINRLFETWIRENPQEWFCSNRMWAKELENSR